jgi:hypothetical protein
MVLQAQQDSFFLEQGIWIEKIDTNQENRDMLGYTLDNEIYQSGYIFTYALKMVDTNQNQQVCNFYHGGEQVWRLVPKHAADSTSIQYITVTVLKALTSNPFPVKNYPQTVIQIDYKNDVKAPFGRHFPMDHWNPEYRGQFVSGGEKTGIIENKKNLWMHPPRTKYFTINQLNPYPFLQFPASIGKKWTWKLLVNGTPWSDKRWVEWKGNVLVTSEYEIQEKTILKTAFGPLECYRVECVGSSRFGKTHLTYYFNDQYGFVSMVFTSIDGNKTILELIEKSKF